MFRSTTAWPDDIFCGTDMAKPGISVGPLFCRPCCARVEAGGNIIFILKRERSVSSVMGEGRKKPEHIIILGLCNVDGTG